MPIILDGIVLLKNQTMMSLSVYSGVQKFRNPCATMASLAISRNVYNVAP